MTSLLESYSWVLAPEKMPNLAFLPHQVLKPGGSPFYFRSSSVKECRSTLELRSKARMLFNSDQPDGKVVGLGGFEPPTSRLSGVRSNQTEL